MKSGSRSSRTRSTSFSSARRRSTAACPYEGVRTLNDGEPEFYLDVELGHITAPKHKANVVEKCNFCAGRLAMGEKPACMEQKLPP